MARATKTLLARPRFGFTLVETVITIAIVSIALLAISQALAFGITHSSDGISQARTINLAQSYFEEIGAKRYAESTPAGGIPACSPTTVACGTIGPEAGENRTSYDDIDDFNGLLDQPPRDSENNLRAGYESYLVSINVRYLSAGEDAALGVDTSTDAKRVAITVTPPGQSAQEFSAIYANF